MPTKPTTRKPLNEDDLLEVTSRAEWRRWLWQHRRTAKETWLVYYRKGSGRERISYNDAVEEALCVGWIDSIVRSIDETRFAQRFSPRKPKTPYSPANQERLRKLIAAGKVSKDVVEAISENPPGGLTNATRPLQGQPAGGWQKEPKLVVAKDILDAIKADKDAWANYRKLSPGYKRIRIGFIEGARNRPAEFQKRLAYFIKMTAKGKLYGFGGIEKYY